MLHICDFEGGKVMAKETCQNCNYCKKNIDKSRIHSTSIFNCIRFPWFDPNVDLDEFPYVQPNDWCVEWKLKE